MPAICSTNTAYKYLWTCNQLISVGGYFVGATDVVADNGTTVIDGGNIITNTITANKLNTTDINASGVLTIGALSNTTQNDILNSNVSVGGRNLLKGSYTNRSSTATAASTLGGTFMQVIPEGTQITISVQVDAENIVWASSGYLRVGCEFYISKTGGGTQYIGAWAGKTLDDGTNITAAFTGSFHGRVSKTFILLGELPVDKQVFLYTQGISSGTATVSNIKV